MMGEATGGTDSAMDGVEDGFSLGPFDGMEDGYWLVAIDWMKDDGVKDGSLLSGPSRTDDWVTDGATLGSLVDLNFGVNKGVRVLIVEEDNNE